MKFLIPARYLLLITLVASLFGPGPFSRVRSVEASPTGPTLRALRLNGVDSFLRVLDHPALTPADNRLTLTAWVNTEVTSGCQTILGKDYRTSYWLGLCNGRLRFYTRGSGTSVTGSTVVPAAWTHIAVTYDGTTRRYYINGELELESTAGNGPLVSNGAVLGIGFDPGSAGTFAPNYSEISQGCSVFAERQRRATGVL